MGALKVPGVVGLAVLLVVPAVLGQPLNPRDLGGPVNQVTGTAFPQAENQTGEEFTQEAIDIQLRLDIVNAEFDMLGVLLGGGKAQTDVEAHARVAIHAVNVSRLETALAGSTDHTNASLNETFGVNTNRTVLTAEEIRAIGGGALLEAFQAYQEAATVAYMEETVPQMTVLSSSFQWSNTRPVEDERQRREATPRDPPLQLDAGVTLRFLDRYTILALAGASDGNDTTEDDLQQRLEAAQTEPFLRRSAFDVLGISQLISLQLPPGWRLNVTATVPEGFTIASASDALVVEDDRRTARYYLDGSQRAGELVTSGLVTLSDRSLVTTTLLAGVLVVGFVLRLPLEMAVFGLRRRLQS